MAGASSLSDVSNVVYSMDEKESTFNRNNEGIFLYILGGRWNIGADVGKRGDIGSNRTVQWCPALAEDWQYFLEPSGAGSFSRFVPAGGFVPGHISAKCHQCHGDCSSMAWDPTVPLLSS